MLWQPHARRWWLWTLQTFACDAAEVLLRAAILPLPFRGSTQGKADCAELAVRPQHRCCKPCRQPLLYSFGAPAPSESRETRTVWGFRLADVGKPMSHRAPQKACLVIVHTVDCTIPYPWDLWQSGTVVRTEHRQRTPRSRILLLT